MPAWRFHHSCLFARTPLPRRRAAAWRRVGHRPRAAHQRWWGAHLRCGVVRHGLLHGLKAKLGLLRDPVGSRHLAHVHHLDGGVACVWHLHGCLCTPKGRTHGIRRLHELVVVTVLLEVINLCVHSMDVHWQDAEHRQGASDDEPRAIAGVCVDQDLPLALPQLEGEEDVLQEANPRQARCGDEARSDPHPPGVGRVVVRVVVHEGTSHPQEDGGEEAQKDEDHGGILDHDPNLTPMPDLVDTHHAKLLDSLLHPVGLVE
mmetsp:Transcript_35589/g.96510  ORF Transcript_35589/g.96510 Transcript_35589/m.96510 type:complete len:260 (-) Transcript_35589:308-1087(-)